MKTYVYQKTPYGSPYTLFGIYDSKESAETAIAKDTWHDYLFRSEPLPEEHVGPLAPILQALKEEQCKETKA